VSGGARQSFDRKRMSTQPVVPGPRGEFKARFKNFSFELGSEYHLDRNKLAYVRFAQGYLAGGINGDAPTLADVSVFKPVTVDSYEVGLKTEWFDRMLTVNVAGFFSDYSNLQLVAAGVASASGFVQKVVNVPGLKIRGVEVEATLRPVAGLTINGSLGYLHARYRSAILNLGAGPADISAYPKENAPKITAYLGANYKTVIGEDNGSLTFDADVNYTSGAYTNPLPSPVAFQSKYALVNGSITYTTPDDLYSLSLFGRNLTNKYYKTVGETATNLFMWDNVGRPRSYGIRATAKF
jgi:iron complex outermembrane receptor protein